MKTDGEQQMITEFARRARELGNGAVDDIILRVLGRRFPRLR
jgi:hypothetical protein